MANEENTRTSNPEFMSRLRESIEKEPKLQAPVPDPPEKWAPPAVRAATAATRDRKAHTRLQTIGEFITGLTYREARAMGKGIVDKLQKDSSLNIETLTDAIQEWAFEWETFEEEQRPGSQ
jgi:ribosomal protein L13E